MGWEQVALVVLAAGTNMSSARALSVAAWWLASGALSLVLSLGNRGRLVELVSSCIGCSRLVVYPVSALVAVSLCHTFGLVVVCTGKMAEVLVALALGWVDTVVVVFAVHPSGRGSRPVHTLATIGTRIAVAFTQLAMAGDSVEELTAAMASGSRMLAVGRTKVLEPMVSFVAIGSFPSLVAISKPCLMG